MKIISHRGNLNGKNSDVENNPKNILEVLKKYDTEIDLWFVNGDLYLGHDFPQYKINEEFLNNNMWIHCKNIEAIIFMEKTNLNWFWHENDKVILTSHKFLWCYPGIYINNGITVETGINKNLPNFIMGICTDYPEKYKL